jgi:hypothetical protein
MTPVVTDRRRNTLTKDPYQLLRVAGTVPIPPPGRQRWEVDKLSTKSQSTTGRQSKGSVSNSCPSGPATMV